MHRSPEAEAAIASLLSLCEPSKPVALTCIAEARSGAVVETISAKYGNDYPPNDDEEYEEALALNKKATLAFVRTPAKSLPELALKLAVMLLDHEHGEPFYMSEPHDNAGWQRIIDDVRSVVASAQPGTNSR